MRKKKSHIKKQGKTDYRALNKHDIIELLWFDHFAVNGWHSTPEEEIPVHANYSTGYFIKQDKLSIIIGQSINTENVGDALIVLKSCIQEISVIKKA